MTSLLFRRVALVQQKMAGSREGMSKKARGEDGVMKGFDWGEVPVERGTLTRENGQETDDIRNDSIDE